ncbi:MAG: ATP-binding protein [Anaerohalosphaeraceae bacterium]
MDSYPAVALLGPRQSGKTTLAKTLGPHYFDLELPEGRTRLDVQWPALIRKDELIVLDEAQSWPEIFPRIRSAIDEERQKNGRFLLLGSISPALMKQVSESLAGRLSLVELSPLLLIELTDNQLDDLWLFGGYPEGGIRNPAQFPQWQKDYLALLTERDLPNWGLPAKPFVTQRLLQMLAAVHGQLWNAHKLSESLGIDSKTLNTYMGYLTGCFLIRRLEPYYANLKKRLIKSPKIYWRDTGLLHSLLNLASFDQLLGHPAAGASWEGFVIEQILCTLSAKGKSAQAFFLRTSDQKELDLILDFGQTQWAFEIKLTSCPSPADVHQFNKTADLLGAEKRFLVCRIREPIESEQILVTNLPSVLSLL